MENNYFNIKEDDYNFYKKLITERFLNNPRMCLLFDKSKNNFYNKVFNLVNYCFLIAIKQRGVYITNNKKAIVLFYEQEKLKKSLDDYINFFKVIKNIPFFKLINVLKNEKEVNKHKLKAKNYIYVWFIAQDKEYKKIDSLIEINNVLFDLAKNSKLPVIFETSDTRLLHLYKRAGFEIYNKVKIRKQIIYFFTDKHTYKKLI